VSDEISEGQESIELAKNIRWGILLGTPVTFVFFFSLLAFSGVSLHRALFAATWTAIVGGTFYGGLTGLLKFSLKHD
jgi:hypothetical protein